MSKLGPPQDVINQEINVDNEHRNAYHAICYRGNYDCMITLLNLERVYLKKILYDQLLKDKKHFRFKNMDIKNGQLSTMTFHDSDSVKRHEDFNIQVFNMLEKYCKDIIDRYRQILCVQDKNGRNPIHYGGMSKFTKCHKTIEAVLTIHFDEVPNQQLFQNIFFQVMELESCKDAHFDPRKYKDVLNEFRHLLSVSDFNRIVQEFNHQVKLLLKEVLNQQDRNSHTPLHLASYFGNFHSSRLFTKLGADASSHATAQAPLELAKDKFSRDVLQTLNGAADSTNTKDLNYLVNCGENIDQRASIVGQAPIHKTVLSHQNAFDKERTLETIFKQNADINVIDSNGWTAMHHAAFMGDY